MDINAPIVLRLNQLNDITDDITELQTNLALKQDLLVSGVNIKTINGDTILGSGDLVISEVTITNFIFVDSLSKLPAPVAGVITLLANHCYYFTTNIDLLGSRLFCQANVVILGTSSENCSITSTGLVSALITTNSTLVIRHITFTSSLVFDIDGGGTAALDWTGVNFLNCAVIGTIKNITNFVYDKGAFLNSSNLTFDGTSQTIAINNSLLTGRSTGVSITIKSTAVISRRFRITYSSISAQTSTTALKLEVGASIPVESFILDTVNFSGTGTYLDGISVLSNLTLFINCKGIPNTSVNGQLYMQNNATATTISNTTNFFKIAGTTIPSADNAKYLHSNNRLTNDAVIERRFLVMATASFTTSNNNVCEFGIYDSTLGAIRTDSISRSTASGGILTNRAENVKIMSLISHNQGDYVEIWCRNTSSTSNITVESLNVIVIES